MTNENEAMSELSSVLGRINLRLDAMEKGEGMPEGLKQHMENKKKDEKKDDKSDEDKGEEMADEEDKKEGMYGHSMNKGEYSDVITEDYLHWMENTLKSAGVDTDGAREHFDQLSKANLGSDPAIIGDGAAYFGGQVKGRAQENGSRFPQARGRPNSGCRGEADQSLWSTSDLAPTGAVDAHGGDGAASVVNGRKSSRGLRF